MPTTPCFCFRSVVLAICVTLPLVTSAQDGATLYKAKCANCHGADGQGKIGPALKNSPQTADQIADLLTKGSESKKPPHKKPLVGASAADAKAIADFIKTLK